MKIVIADDNKFFKEALVMFLESELNHEVIAQYENGEDLLNNLQELNPELVLLDIEMPVLNGIKAMQEINKRWPCTKVIAITDYCEMVYLKDLIMHGFKGCVYKDDIFNKMHQAIELVSKGQYSFPKGISIN